jgi:crossover junction endodeoxyribonuclease RuvC
MITIGIDPSVTGTGVSVQWDSGGYDAHTIKTKPGDWAKTTAGRFARFCFIRNSIIEVLERNDIIEQCECICIEAYSYGSKGKGVSSIYELGAVIRLMLIDYCDELGIDLYEIPPTSVKKFVTGKGNADKVKMAVSISSKYGVELANDNEYDAYGLALIATCLAGGREPDTAYQREVIEKIKGGA